VNEPLCSIARALDVVGTRSTMLLLREAFYGTRRFDDFARRAEVTEQVTAIRLKALVRDGLLDRVPYQDAGKRTRSEYRLTGKGRELYPVLVALMQWGDSHVPAPTGVPVRLVHPGCGATVGVSVRCEAGHELTPQQVSALPGPGLPDVLADRVRAPTT